jgi:hypothetical protein
MPEVITPPSDTKYGRASLDRLATCHPDLQRIAFEVEKVTEASVVFGHRTKLEQDEAFRLGRSTVRWPNSKHNRMPSNAIDLAPWDGRKIPWEDREKFRAFGGLVLGVAHQMGIKLRWGGDWDGDWDFNDQRFIDMPHFELVEA